MTKRTSSSQSSNTQRATVTGISGIVIIIIVLFAQFALGINVLNTDKEPADDQADQPEVVVEPPFDDTGTGTGGTPSASVQPVMGGIDGGWFQLYFTQPINSQDEANFHDAPLEVALVAALDGAQRGIDAAVFELNSQPVTDALIAATERGVTVRVVTDGEYGLEDPETTLDQLEFADIAVVSDGMRNGLMHNKFFVIDDLYVWTGSTNITHNGMYNNNNNAMLIRSSRLAANFTTEFEEMLAGNFGKTSATTIPNPSVTVEGTQIETIFESEGDVPARLTELIQNADSVRFMAFSLTRDDLIEPMLTRAQAGELDLMGIVEASQRRFVQDLICPGLQVHQDGNPDVLHHKIFIFDESIVAMGSFNFSARAADDNDENLLIIHNTDIAQAYLEEFAKRWSESEVVPPDELDC